MAGFCELIVFGGLIYWLFNERLRAMVDILSTRLQEVYTRWEGRGKPPMTQRVQQTPHSLMSQAKTIRQRKREAINELKQKEIQVLDRELFKIKENEWNILPEKKKRPFMGLSCSTCTPSSRSSLLEKGHQNVNLINVLWVHQLDTHPQGLLPKLFPQLCHALSFKKYPFPYIYDSVLQDDHLQEVMEIAARRAVEDAKATADTSALTSALKRQHERAIRILTILRSTFSDIILRISSYVINKVMARLFSRVVVHPSQIQMLRRAEKSNLPLIFLPLHRSHLDYIVITFILCNGNIRSPLVAAGENLNIPVFGWLLRCLGAFFIKRRMDPITGQRDILYRAILHTYMIQCLGAGHNFEFFIEGGRTRSGKPCMPKGGLLSVLIDAYMDGTIDDALLVPVSINYERLVDGNFVREQMGKPKQMETFGSALSAIWHALTSHYGTMRVDFNQPFSLRELVTTFKTKLSTLNGKKILHTVPSSASLYGTDVIEEHRQLVDSIARHVIYDCCRSTAVMSTNATSFLLLNLYRTGIQLEVLVEAMDKLRDQIRLSDRDLGFTGESVDVVNHAIDVLGPGLIRRERDAEGIIITPVTILPNVIELSYYSNALLPHFVLEAVVATAANSLLKAKNLTRSVFHNELMEQSLTLCDILQFEFIFTRTCQSLSAALGETIETFCSYDIFLLNEKLFTEEQEWGRRFAQRMDEDASDDILSDGESENNNELGPEYQVHIENEKFCLYKVLLQAIIDGYTASALNLYQLVSRQVPERDHVEAVLHDIRIRLDTGEFTRGESLSVDAIRNSLKLLEKWDVLDCHNQDQIKLYYLGAQYDDEASFASVITKIQQFQ